MDTKYRIGTIARCFGIKGEVIVNPETYDINRYFDLQYAYVGLTESNSEFYKVESVRLHRQRPLIKFRNVETRSDAERLAGRILFVDEGDRIELPEGVLFIHDIIGMSVVTDESSYVGIIKDVLVLPAHNVYVVGSKGKEILIPAVDAFIESIDREKKEIRIKPVEGLLE